MLLLLSKVNQLVRTMSNLTVLYIQLITKSITVEMGDFDLNTSFLDFYIRYTTA